MAILTLETKKYAIKIDNFEGPLDLLCHLIDKNKMNIFTFGKLKCFFNIKVIGYPCSLSNCGYVTNNEKFMFDYIKTIRGVGYRIDKVH